mgnify:FL=1
MQSHLQKISSVYRVSYASSVQLGNNNKIEILGKVKKAIGKSSPFSRSVLCSIRCLLLCLRLVNKQIRRHESIFLVKLFEWYECLASSLRFDSRRQTTKHHCSFDFDRDRTVKAISLAATDSEAKMISDYAKLRSNPSLSIGAGVFLYSF